MGRGTKKAKLGSDGEGVEKGDQRMGVWEGTYLGELRAHQEEEEEAQELA